MAADTYDIQLQVGATWEITVRLPQADGWPALTGATVAAAIAERAGVAPLTAIAVAVRAADDEIDLSLSESASAALSALKAPGAWDLRVEWPDGEVRYPLAGRVYAQRMVTA